MTEPDTTDEQLMAGVQRGDHDALRRLFDRYQGSLFGFFYSRLGQSDPAEDLVQTVFIRTWKHRGSFQPGRRLRPWLFRLARNALADAAPRNEPAPLHEDLSTREPDPAERLERAERAARIRRAVSRLPESQRDALLMSRWSGMSYREIGNVLGCSEGAVKLRMFRAMQTLRSLLEREEDR